MKKQNNDQFEISLTSSALVKRVRKSKNKHD